MGRTHGKLVPFLMEGLVMEKYINLSYDSEKSQFELDLPRYDKNMKSDYERILKEWFAINGKTYVNYSNGKSVLKAAMKKSPYIISLKTVNKKLQFRFSSPQEIEEKRKYQKGRQAELHKNIFKEEMPPSVASSGYVSGHDNSPAPFEGHDQLKVNNVDNAVDAVVPNNEDSMLWDDDCFMGTINDSPDEILEINADDCFANMKLDETDKEKCSISKHDFDELCKNIVDAYDVSLEYDSLPVSLPLHEDQSSVNADSDSGALGNLKLDPLRKNINDFNDVLDLPELPSKSGNMASDQSLCADLNQPKSAIESSEIPASSSSVQIPEKQNVWICFNKMPIGSLIEYICMPMLMNLISLANADSTYQFVPIIENSKNASCVLIGTTFWEPGRTLKQHMVISDGKYLLVFFE